MTFVAIGILIFIGTIVQGAIGFGLGTLATPIIAILYPELLPVVILCLALVIALTTAFRDRDVAWNVVGWSTLTRIPGSALGAWAISALSTDALSLFIGFAVIFAMSLSGLGWSPKPTTPTFLAAGAAAGILGTSTSIGGPPMALAMKRFDPTRIRGTLAIVFLLGSSMSLIILSVGGQITALQLKAAAAYLPLTIVGLVVARKLIPYINSTLLNHVVIAVSSCAALILIAEATYNLVGN